MQYRTYYEEPGKLGLGDGTKNSLFISGYFYKPTGQLWCCPTCAEAWMRVTIVDSSYVKSKYMILANDCEWCGKLNSDLLYKTRLTLPGSILMEGYNTIEELSDEMLRRELLLELNAVKYLINKGLI